MDLELCADAADTKPKPVPVWRMLEHADCRDKATLALGIALAAVSGLIAPLFAIIIGASANATSGNPGHVLDSMVFVIEATFVLFGVTVLNTAAWQTCFLWTSARISTRMRVKHLQKVLTHDIAWFDRRGELAAIPSKMSAQSQAIEDAIGTKLGDAVGSAAVFVAGLVLAFFFSWKLTLALCAAIPVVGFIAGSLSESFKAMMAAQEAGFASAGAIAQEAITSIRTVVAFGTEQHEVEKFAAELEPARRIGMKASACFGLSIGALFGSMGAIYAFALWFGAVELIAKEGKAGGEVITVCISLIIGMSGLVSISTPLMSLARGSVAMGELVELVAAEPEIEASKEEVEKTLPPQTANVESIEFRNVSFRYPRRLDVQVLNGLRLTIRRGQKVALVGESGSGKSTVFQLLERFYDPVDGEVLINGFPLTQLPVKAWRRQIGYVGQEPVLFDTTVLANIKGGNLEITDEQAVEAARQARVYDFVRNLPDKFETQVSAGGEQMSGGQKQRIAIARALVKKPQVLLLDEATSALDNESERQVQATLDALQSSGTSLTTITIAHRLSTVRNSDTIFVLHNGAILEQGSDSELLLQEGEYYRLVQAQTVSTSSSEDSGSAVATNDAGSEVPVDGNLPDRPVPSLPMLLGRGPFVDSELQGEQSKPGTGRAGGGGGVTPMAHALPARGRSTKSAKSWMVSKLDGEEDEAKTEKELEKERLAAIGDYRTPITRLLRLSRPEWAVYPVGILMSWLVGAVIPVQSCLFTMAFGCFYLTPVEVMLAHSAWWCRWLLLSGIVQFLSQFGMHSLFGVIQHSLVKRLRELTFKSALRQEVGYFDCLQHGGAGFVASMGRDTVSVAQITGGSVGLSLAGLLAIVTGLVIALYTSWRLSLVLLATMPLVVIGVAAAAHVSEKVQGDSAPHKKAGATACEALLNVRTVRALQAEKQTIKIFSEALYEALAKDIWAAPRKGLVMGFAQSLTYPVFVAGLWYGCYLIQHEGLDSNAVYLALLCILSSFSSATMIVSHVPQAAQGRLAAHNLFTTIDRTSEIDAFKPSGWHRSLGSGSIVFDNVAFRYPARPQVDVLQGLSFAVGRGQAVALVGASGSGKTTVTQLLQRFYDPVQGVIKVGGVDLRQFDVAWWRRQIGFVGQEPVLFDLSLEDNVRYGCPEAEKADVEEAAREANMDYVFNGSIAWEDKIGYRGQRLSGGQKQRCAIARALLRRPQILILDEATSALDSASEALVQQALETAKAGRTTFTIAHRLSTIADADLILVMSAGAVVESGTAEELMAKEGIYYNLAQQGSED